jgi:hypothetical protein
VKGGRRHILKDSAAKWIAHSCMQMRPGADMQEDSGHGCQNVTRIAQQGLLKWSIPCIMQPSLAMSYSR